MPFSIASSTTRTGSISPATPCDAHAQQSNKGVIFLPTPKPLLSIEKGGHDIAAPSQKTHERPSYERASFALSGFAATPRDGRLIARKPLTR
jgi:hypothetical protein